ncbi:2-nitropropane dioxygenase NPD [Hyphomicrobium denitrificans 1NES1]|uniref:2-nitropropane dioxygenase NPD n=1 Tax=Hyphomicrobium denitrificans 1NES1 TaxID=670307 RepID=N0BCG6_9HYPH|nr:nitronate monooxygenase [Hyphomicrobium denitrificans]AGK58226.1 2-nitropropane dioxygenase NPD [Hyphomicrobium denitrificans 1NES1]
MLKTRLTERMGLRHPIISAPMAFAAGGRLAAAVSAAGGLGLIGGGYGDAGWITQEFRAAGNQPVGCGFITWSLAKQPALLDLALSNKPKAIILSFGDPEPFAKRIKDQGVTLICQVQTRRDAAHAMACGADIIVAQGAEAGGHGQSRGTLSLVPEVADLIAKEHPETILCATGGIGDGRGVAAAFMLGADGVMVGSRLWASKEANVSERMHEAALNSTGDDTIRSQTMDLARKLDWPRQYNARVLVNEFIRRWHGRESELIAVADEEAAKYRAAWVDGDPEKSNTFVGEVVGLIRTIEPASDIIERMMREAEELLQSKPKDIISKS